MVYLHSPRVFHSLMVLSREPETICLLSAEKATERTSFACPTNRRVVRPDWISHSRRVPSQDPDLWWFWFGIDCVMFSHSIAPYVCIYVCMCAASSGRGLRRCFMLEKTMKSVHIRAFTASI